MVHLILDVNKYSLTRKPCEILKLLSSFLAAKLPYLQVHVSEPCFLSAIYGYINLAR